MKRYLLAGLLLFVTSAGFSQFYKSLLPSPAFTRALDSVVLDFRLDYRNIQGNPVDTLAGSGTYESLVKLPGAAECRILRMHSPEDTTACWQAIIYTGEDYKEAVRAYENTVRLVKKSQIRWIDRSVVKFTGELVPVRENLRFTTSVLRLKLDDPRYENFRAEIEILATGLDTWEVQLNLSKKPEHAK
ncbi:MAG: hypothetical protein K0Q66_488 [Chitinophagaceae bacterium]|jgi:hypothetical protein|nr:hypothetical protein [Chitinophagaceae bacterium]